MKSLSRLSHLADERLLAEVTRLAANERAATAALLVAISELDSRRLYLGVGCSSLFTYCTRVLRLSEHAAYHRIEAARAARRFPTLLDLLAEGALTLTTATLLAPHLTAENHESVLEEARFKTKREVEEQVAALRPQPPVPSSVRKLQQRLPELPAPSAPPEVRTTDTPSPMSTPSVAPAPRQSQVKPLAPELFEIQVTVGRETRDKLRRVQDLLRHSNPTGDLAVIFDKAITLLLADIEKKKLAAVERPRHTKTATSESRHIPSAVRRAVWKRDDGQCAFVGTHGRCNERGLLEFHHIEPFAAGGSSDAENLQLRCRAHIAYEAELFFGALDGVLVREVAASYNVS